MPDLVVAENQSSLAIKPENLPGPEYNSIAILQGLAVNDLPIPGEAKLKAGEDFNAKITAFYNESQKDTGIIPTGQEASMFALQCLQCSYPVTKQSKDKSIESTLVEGDTDILKHLIEKFGPNDSFVLEYAQLIMKKMRDSYAGYLGEMTQMKVHMDTDNFEKAKTLSQPSGLTGPEIEMYLLESKAFKEDLGVSELNFMHLLSNYRSFVLASELATASKLNKPVDKVLVEQIWKANNVRRAIIEHVAKK